jgi:hypothetical protein
MSELLTVRLHKCLRTPWAVAPSGCHIVGTVYCGMEFGFLVAAAGGAYLRVNGSVTQWLDRDEVLAAIRCAQRVQAARPMEAQPLGPPAEAVTVRHKKRRVPAGG